MTYICVPVVSCASPFYAKRAREGLGTRAHTARTLGMYDASCSVHLVSPNRINAVGRLAGARTLLWHMRSALSIIHTLAVAGPELCDLIGVLKFLDRYTPDVLESPDPLSLFQNRRGWRARLVYLYLQLSDNGTSLRISKTLIYSIPL